MNEPEIIREMLGDASIEARTIAVVGLSEREDRPSHYVSAYMQQQGYKDSSGESGHRVGARRTLLCIARRIARKAGCRERLSGSQAHSSYRR